jgi:hypothetical protein
VTIEEHVAQFAGLAVVNWEAGMVLAKPERTAYRLSVEYGEADGTRWIDKLTGLLADPESSRIAGIVVGPWSSEIGDMGSSEPIIEALIAARDRLPGLRAVFLGDIVREENEISWINQSDVAPLLSAYPNLEHFRVRGSEELALDVSEHQRLQSLTIECGGLPRDVLQQVLAARLPALEHLELWLGTDSYGWDGTVEDLAPLLSGTLFPKLRYLGLRDSEIADEVAVAAAQAPILERIEVLDLSLGTLSDEGALALLKSPLIRQLKKLDIHHHFCSAAMVAELEGLGIEVDGSEPTTPDEWDGEEHRYVAVGE